MVCCAELDRSHDGGRVRRRRHGDHGSRPRPPKGFCERGEVFRFVAANLEENDGDRLVALQGKSEIVGAPVPDDAETQRLINVTFRIFPVSQALPRLFFLGSEALIPAA